MHGAAGVFSRHSVSRRICSAAAAGGRLLLPAPMPLPLGQHRDDVTPLWSNPLGSAKPVTFASDWESVRNAFRGPLVDDGGALGAGPGQAAESLVAALRHPLQ